MRGSAWLVAAIQGGVRLGRVDVEQGLASAPSSRALTCDDNPPFLSYHVHVLFWQNNATSVANAKRLYLDFASSHAAGPLPNCTSDGSALIYPGKGTGASMKMCFGGVALHAVGPFPTAQLFWAVGLNEFGAVLPWLMRHNEAYEFTSVFVHPVTGCDTQDHMDRSLWLGRRWPLDPSGLACDKVGCDGDAEQKKCTDSCPGLPP